jgi:hypothetical protein
MEMADSACFVFFTTDSRCTLDTAAKGLAERGLSVKQKADELVVCFPGKPVLRVSLATDDYVREEAAELSKGTPFFTGMSDCDARFEILIDDLDAVLGEINTLIDVQQSLQELTHGFLYCTWNAQLSGGE